MECIHCGQSSQGRGGKSQGWPHLSQATAKSSSCIKTLWDMVWAFRTAKHCVKKGRTSLELILCWVLWGQDCSESNVTKVPTSRAAAPPGHPLLFQHLAIPEEDLAFVLVEFIGVPVSPFLDLPRSLWVPVLPSQVQTAAPVLHHLPNSDLLLHLWIADFKQGRSQ